MTSSEADGDPPRLGEVATTAPLPVDAHIAFIGRIATPWAERAACPRQGDRHGGPTCQIHVDPTWMAALDGIERHAELQVLYWMHLARRDLVRLAPRSHAEPRGPFALRAPTRPNPIASTVVAMLGRDGPIVNVRGLDCVDGTPLLDLKPWRGA